MTEKCNACEQMKSENKLLRKSLMDTNRNYVDVVNENLSLRRKLTQANIYYHGGLGV
jgi:hypothetical protein